MRLDKILADSGYDIKDYQVDVRIFSEHNQVIIIHDLLKGRDYSLPVEEHVLSWPGDKLAGIIIDMLNAANGY